MNENTDLDVNLDDIRTRAIVLRGLFARLSRLLQVHSEGYLLILLEPVDEVYVRIRTSIELMLNTEGMQELAARYPKDSIPASLHALGNDADVIWDSLREVLNGFTGELITFAISVGADNSHADPKMEQILSSYDSFIRAFEKDKKAAERNFLQRAEVAGKRFQEQFSQAPGNKPVSEPFVSPTRLSELREIKSTDYDLTRLIGLCNELNNASASESYMAVAMLVRALLDHVPPIFGCSNFVEVANQYRGSRSFKQSMTHLEASSRKIADGHLHTQIRSKEVLPNRTQVAFSSDLDVLLAEVVRLLK